MVFDELKTFFDGLKPEELKNHSEAFIENKRLGKSNYPDAKFRQEQIDKEYLNFDKYEKNKIELKDWYDEIEEDHLGLSVQGRKFAEAMWKLKLEQSEVFH